MTHWTDRQQWRELDTHEVVSAGALRDRYDRYFRVHRIALIDACRGVGVRMDDGTVWYRWTDKADAP